MPIKSRSSLEPALGHYMLPLRQVASYCLHLCYWLLYSISIGASDDFSSLKVRGLGHGGWTNRRTWEMYRIKQGEVTPKQWAETRTVSGRSSLKMIFAAILTYMCQRVVPLSNVITQYMYSSNIIDMPHVFSPRFVTQIFVASIKLLLRSILCAFIRLYEFTTDFLLWIARPLWFLVVSYHDIAVILMYNEIQSQRGQQSILVFLWRLTSENVNA